MESRFVFFFVAQLKKPGKMAKNGYVTKHFDKSHLSRWWSFNQFFVQTTLGPKCSKLRSPYYFSNGLVQQPTTSFLEVIFWFPKWRSLNPGKGHLKLSKRSRTEEPGRFFFCDSSLTGSQRFIVLATEFHSAAGGESWKWEGWFFLLSFMEI